MAKKTEEMDWESVSAEKNQLKMYYYGKIFSYFLLYVITKQLFIR